MKKLVCIWLILLPFFVQAQNQTPQITLRDVQVNEATGLLTVNYDLSDAENDSLEVSMVFSNDAGKLFSIPATGASGDIGFPVFSGSGKKINWNYRGQLTGGLEFHMKLIASDRQPVDIQAMVDQVDSIRLRQDLQFIQGIRHRRAGAAHLQAVKDTIAGFFLSENLPVNRLGWVYATTYNAENILAKHAGTTKESNWYLIGGHFDSVEESPGADDNGAAIAGMFEAARILTQYHFKKSIRFAGFDLEEQGLIGSTRFVSSQMPPMEQMQGFFDFEMIGYFSNRPNTQRLPTGFNLLFPDATAALAADSLRGNFITNVSNTPSAPLMQAFESAAKKYVPGLKVVSLQIPGNGSIAPDLNRSDHTPFWNKDYQALMLTDGAEFRNRNYHQPTDVLDSLNFSFMANVVKATIAAVATLAEAEHSSLAVVALPLITSVQDVQRCRFSILPNPAFDRVQIHSDGCALPASRIDLISPGGQIVRQWDIESNQQVWLNLSGINPGIYFMKIQTDQDFQVQRILKR
jgi:hypothetical protein